MKSCRKTSALASIVAVITVCLMTRADTSSHRRNAVPLAVPVAGAEITPRPPASNARTIAMAFDPHRNLREAKQAVMVDELRSILALYPRRIDPDSRDRLAELLVEQGFRTGLDPIFLAAVIRVESAFSTRAISNKGARGLMQVMPATARELAGELGMHWRGPRQLHDLEFNVRVGSMYLKQLLSMYAGNYRYALTAYNRGPHNLRAIVKRHGRLHPRYTEYWRKIRHAYRRYMRLIGKSGRRVLAFT